jgi:hypothetical protein
MEPMKKRMKVAAILAVLLVGLLIQATFGQIRPQTPELLPKETVALLTIPQVSRVLPQVRGTNLGKMFEDPALRPWAQEIYGWVGQVFGRVAEQTGVGVGELASLFEGEISIALAESSEGPALVVLVDFAEAEVRINELLSTLEKSIQAGRARLAETTLAGFRVRMVEREAARTERFYYLVLDKTFIGASYPDVLEKVLGAWVRKRGSTSSQSGPEGERAGGTASLKEISTLQESSEFLAVLSECRKLQKERPLVFWYVDPWNLLRVAGRDNPNVQFFLLMAPLLGLDRITAAGGAISAAIGPLDWFTQSHLIVQGERTGALGLLSFGAGDYRPPRWVPAECTNYSTLNWRLQEGVEAIRTILDGFRGQGSLARDLSRLSQFLRVNVEEEILPVLTGRIVFASYIEWPASAASRAQLVGLEVRDSEKARDLVNRLGERFANVFSKEEAGVYQFFVAQRALGPGPATVEDPRRLTFGCVDGWILVADRKAAFQKAVASLEGASPTLAETEEFKQMAARIDERVNPLELALMTYEFPRESLRYLFELAQRPEGRRRLEEAAQTQRWAQAILSLVEKQGLPPFGVIEKYLVPQGSILLSDETGLHYLTFTFREAPEGGNSSGR